MMAGAVSGLFWAVAVTPFELVKCVAQKEGRSAPAVWRERVAALGYASCFRGLQIAVARDLVGVSMYFGMYHTCGQAGHSPFMSGGLASVVTWLIIMPADLVKTRYQTVPQCEQATTLSQSARATYKEFGPFGMWRGLSVTLVRKFVTVGIAMTVAEELRGFLGDVGAGGVSDSDNSDRDELR